MDAIRHRIAVKIRHQRETAGIAPAELARRAGVSKATVSQLESGTGNPTVETLWAIANALGVPFAALVDEPEQRTRLIRAEARSGVPGASAPYAATLVSASPSGVRRDIYLIEAQPGRAQRSAAHVPGAMEHVIVLTGAAIVGPEHATEHLSPGDYLAYPADGVHLFEATQPGTTAVLVTEQR